MWRKFKNEQNIRGDCDMDEGRLSFKSLRYFSA